MSEFNSDPTVLGGQVTEYLRNEKAAYDDNRPVERPALLDDPKAPPHRREEAGQMYAEALIKKHTLTKDELAFLGAAITEHLKENR